MAGMEYAKALKLGQKAYRSAAMRGEYPYLPALDEILECVEVQGEVNLGLVDIPLEKIVGTKTVSRKNAFAVNFMPLMAEKSEFASKWNHVYQYQLQTGVSDPIVAYEYMNRFYVLEGNKRVSVLKFFHASSIEGSVIRIVPKPSEDPENKLYYEFMDFYSKTKINYIWFSKLGSFSRLVKAVGKGGDEIWTEEERRDFSSLYAEFFKLYKDKGGEKFPITTGDALLFCLSIYPYAQWKEKPLSQKKSDLEKLWGELPLLKHSPEKALVLEPVQESEAGLMSLFLSLANSKVLKVAFIHDKKLENSSWTYSHELGRTYLEQVFGSQIVTSSYFLEGQDLKEEGLLQKAIEEKNHIIFTTHQRFLSSSLKMALEHPNIKFLNCSVNRPFGAVRTYYGRMYEAKFLCGMIAGAMCGNDKIAYLADYPIYGTFANINAFALGARMTNPRARIYLNWASDETDDLEQMLERESISMISDMDMIRPYKNTRKFGLYVKNGEDYQALAFPVWNWGKFYEQIIRNILRGIWNKTPDVKEKKALNYWWGISGGVIDVITSQNLPEGLEQLIQLMKQEIDRERFHPFQGRLPMQGGSILGEKGSVLSPEQIITMDWLAENVVGQIPRMSDLTREARTLVALQSSFSLEDESEV